MWRLLWFGGDSGEDGSTNIRSLRREQEKLKSRRGRGITREDWQEILDGKGEYTASPEYHDDKEFSIFIEVLQTNTTITELNLYNNSIGDTGAKILAELIKVNKTITIVDLSYNSIGPIGASAIAEALILNKTITNIGFYHNSLEDGGAISIANVLPLNRITVLGLEHNSIGSGGASAIGEAIKNNHSIKQLKLYDNSIGAEGAIALAKGLKENRAISHLGLAGNSLGDEGSFKIATSLKKNNTVTYLDLYSNFIEDTGAIALADLLFLNKSLTYLDLSYNSIGDAGAQILAEAIKLNESITYLSLSHNCFGIESEIAIAEAIKFNRTITQLHGVLLKDYWRYLSLPDIYADKGNKEILEYMRQVQLSLQSTILYRMKVMLIGPGDAGKTTLVHRIMTGEFRFGQFSMTDGVSMKVWKPLNDVPIIFSLWDFGGQEMYLNSHPLLFSDQTLYLLIWNPRSATPVSTLEEYVMNIRSRSKSAPIMLVTTRSSEVDIREYERCLNEIAIRCKTEGISVRHFPVDSKTGDGIEELKASLIQYVMTEYSDFARVLVPNWYGDVESKLQEQALARRFSIEYEEFVSICSSCWPDSLSVRERVLERANTVLLLFHHWGLIYLLPKPYSMLNGQPTFLGDIVLNPQHLADIFRSIITASRNIHDTHKNLLRNGVLIHDQVGYLWPDYDPRLHMQFLSLFHDCELAYEIFDSKGDPIGESLVPSLLPEPLFSLHTLSELELRKTLFCRWEKRENSPLKVNNRMISRGYINITFDRLLPNFFPKLLVRLRHMSSPSLTDCSRIHCVIHLPERIRGQFVGWSLCCVIEDQKTSSLTVYPGGFSFDATCVAHETIRCLLDECFSGMMMKDVIFSADDALFSKEILINLLKADCLPPIPLQPFTYLFPGYRKVQEISSISFDDPLLTSLSYWFIIYRDSRGNEEKFELSRSFSFAVPIFRQNGLLLSRYPPIMWLAGKTETSIHLVALSPRLLPCDPWEIVWDCRISFSLHNIHQKSSSRLSRLLLDVVTLLLPDEQLPRWYDGNEEIQTVGLVDCSSVAGMIADLEHNYFDWERNYAGGITYYARRFRRSLNPDEAKTIIRSELDHTVDQIAQMQRSAMNSIHGILQNIKEYHEAKIVNDGI